MPERNEQLDLIPENLCTLDHQRERARALRRAGVPVSKICVLVGAQTMWQVHSWVQDIPPANPNRRVRAKDE
jgi:hypothetical protein